MATWTNIPDSVLEPGKPARSVDALALRDNAIAIAEGAAGAPRVVAAGLASNSVTTSKIVNSNVTAAKLATGNNERDWVLARTGAADAGAVGTYAFVTRVTRSNSTGRVQWGNTMAGSSLRPVSIADGGAVLMPGVGGMPSVPALAGTWRGMGLVTGGSDGESPFATLALRIS